MLRRGGGVSVFSDRIFECYGMKRRAGKSWQLIKSLDY